MALFTKDIWLIGPEDKAKHGQLFQSLKPVNGKLSGEQSKKYFMKSNLPTPVLGQIWGLADLDNDGRMTVQEFTIALCLIEAKLKGIDIPKCLPPSLRNSSHPNYHGFSDSSLQAPLQPMQPSHFMNGTAGGGTPHQPAVFGMTQNMNVQQISNMSYSSTAFSATSMSSLPRSFGGYATQQPPQNISATLPRVEKGNFLPDSSVLSSPVKTSFKYGMSQSITTKSAAFDSLSLDKLTDLSNFNKDASSVAIGQISAPHRLKYTQLFKTADDERSGLLSGEKARNLLIQTNVNPQVLSQIWELSDVNKDGSLDVDEFIIAMHLIDSVKAGASLPTVLPTELIPSHLRGQVNAVVTPAPTPANTSPGIVRSGSLRDGTSSLGGCSFEERRRMNWDKGQQELERRRKELLERRMREKEALEQKEREEEEQRRLMREEAERKRLQELENERLQKEEMERKQEQLRKEMIEKRLAAQLEAERQRQQEWENRRKEELLNQKGHEENIVNDLNTRLTRLKENLATETSNRDLLSDAYEKKKSDGRDLRVQIEDLNKSRELRFKEIARLEIVLKQSKADLSNIIQERERFTLDLNLTDSTTTSEALGAIRSSVRQMKGGISLLRSKLTSIEAETVTVLEESNKINLQHKELKRVLQDHLTEATRLKQECEQKKSEECERLRLQEENRRKLEMQKKKQDSLRNQFERELKNRQLREEEAMRKEKQIQVASHRQRQEAQTGVAQKPLFPKYQQDVALKTQQNLLKKQDEILQKQQEALESIKIPPARPRTRPQCSPVKHPSNFTNSPTVKDNSSTLDKNISDTLNENAFTADFSSFEKIDNPPDILNNKVSGKGKKPPPRPVPPSKPGIDISTLSNERSEAAENINWFDNRKETSEDSKKQREEEAKRRKEAEEAEKDRLEKEKARIEQLKQEEAEKEQKLSEERLREQQQKVKEEMEKEKIRKDAEVKRKVEEMQRKRLEKKQATLKASPDRPTAAPVVEQYAKKSTYKMLFPFEARNSDEITLNEGDILQVDENDKSCPEGWLMGTLNGVTGLFPANYATKMKDNFSDYVDLDMNSSDKRKETQRVKRNSFHNQLSEQKTEDIPKLKPVPKNVSRKPSGGNTPKVALLPPKAPLKTLLSTPDTNPPAAMKVKQAKTASPTDNESLKFPSYDLVLPQQENKNNYNSAENTNDLYEVPPSSLNYQVDDMVNQTITEDVYQVPGEVTASEEEIIQVVALYPYSAPKDDHLSFDKNDYIKVEQQQGQWWFGESNGKSGWFPKSYVKQVGGGKLRTPSTDSGKNETIKSIPKSNEGVTQKEVCVALFDYTGPEGDLCFQEGAVITIIKKEGDWWQGELHGKSGSFPCNYVKMKETEVEVKKPEVAVVSMKYSAAADNQISLNNGQLVHVIEKEGDWWQGELQVRGKNKPLGWFPKSHVKLMSKSSKVEEVVAPAADMQTIQEDIYSAPVKKKDQFDHVLAMFSYTAHNEDELTFYKGSVINVISKDGDWWKGELNGQVGVFPYNYVQVLGSNTPEKTNQWSGAFDSTLLKSMSATERQRQNHIYELINTEQDYMNDLSTTLEVFYNPMAEANIMSEQELNTVFVNWKELIMCNMKFLKALLVRKKMSVTDKIEGIGDVLIEQLPRFSPYIRFCSCMLKACRLLQDRVEKDSDFKQFEKKCAGDSRLKQNLPLSSYLLKPLQRITKYPLIITGILNYTPEDHFDRENLLIALEKAEDLCSQINEAVRSQESSSRLEWLQERVNLEGLEESLVFNSQTNCLGQRKYIYHGTLHKHKSNKELKAFLFNDFLLLCRVQSGYLMPKNSSGLFHPDNDTKLTIYKKPIFLNEVIVKTASDPDVNETLFHVTHIDRVYSFRAESKTLRNTWVSKIQAASQLFIETEREKRSRASRARSLIDNEVGRLVVTIIEGADLQASDPTGTSDPYCQVSMGSQEHRTKVIQKDLNPKWNSTMVFNVKDFKKDVLCISVFDRDFFSPNDFLGRTEVSVASIMEKGKGPLTKRLLLHEVATGEIVVTLELQNFKIV